MQLLPTGDPSKYGLSDINTFLKNAIDIALYLAGGIAVIYIIIGAYGYFTAFGNEERASKAKNTITWAIIGLVVMILAKVILAEIWSIVTPAPLNFPT